MRLTPVPLSVAFVSVLLAACGGGSEPSGAPSERTQALASVGAKEVFDWAAFKYPTLFQSGSADFPFNYNGVDYTVRGFSGGNYLGITPGGAIYGLGPFTNNVLTGFGNKADYEALIQADSCTVYPGSCTPGTLPPGPLNECTLTAAQALVTGNRLILKYETTGIATGTTDLDVLVEGPATFEGQSAVRIAETVTNTFDVGLAMTSTSTIKSTSYEQAADGGFIRTLGFESEFSSGGLTTSSRTVFAPGELNAEFGLRVGQSFTQTSSGTRTTTTPGLPPTTSSFTDQETNAYEARENLTVRGKTYDTCRYRSSSPGSDSHTLNWIVVGKGIAARSRTVSGTEVTMSDLVAGSINGAPI